MGMYDDLIYCTKCGKKLTQESVPTGKKRFHPKYGQKQVEITTIKVCSEMKDIFDEHAYYIEKRFWKNE